MSTHQEKDFVRILRDAYSSGYPHLLQKMDVGPIAVYNNTSEFSSKGLGVKNNFPNLLKGKSMSDFADIWAPKIETLACCLEHSMSKAALMPIGLARQKTEREVSQLFNLVDSEF